jgi:hypothetical protein
VKQTHGLGPAGGGKVTGGVVGELAADTCATAEALEAEVAAEEVAVRPRVAARCSRRENSRWRGTRVTFGLRHVRPTWEGWAEHARSLEFVRDDVLGPRKRGVVDLPRVQQQLAVPEQSRLHLPDARDAPAMWRG